MKDRLRELKKNGLHRYKYLVFGRDSSYFEKKALILPKSYLKLVSHKSKNNVSKPANKQ
jgi:hypothetical protein